ncbi:MAG: glycosyltransferase [candidate division Zixibacteria bacterium]|nr:glycosyltransferase [candidate division Zixibacteria bacterium]
MKTVILTQYFPPEMGAAQNRIYSLARAFLRQGHDITVLTALPNYPTGEIFDDYKGLYKCRENIDGIEIIRSWLYIHESRNAASLALSYLTFALTAFNVGSREIDKADLLLWEYPPPFLGYTARKLAKKWNAKLATNIADLWTDALEEQKVLSAKFILDRISAFENKIMQDSTAITGQTEGVLADIKKRFPRLDPILWPNGADPDLFSPEEPSFKPQKRYRTEGKFVVGYSGLHGRNHNLRLVLDAAKLLQSKKDIVFMLCGDGFEKKSLIEYAKQNGLDNVQFHDPIPHAELPELLSLFGIGIVIHRNLPGLKVVRSAKLFELMSMEIPILHCAESEGAEIIRRANAGLVVSEEDPQKIADSILEMRNSQKLAEWGKNGRRHVIDHFDRDKISDDLVKKLEKTV